jgi:hypothetical protein
MKCDQRGCETEATWGMIQNSTGKELHLCDHHKSTRLRSLSRRYMFIFTWPLKPVVEIEVKPVVVDNQEILKRKE